MAQQTFNREQEIQQIRKEYPYLYPFTLGIVILGIGFLLGATWFKGDDNGLSYATNLYTELISIGVTIVILDRINRWRDERRLKNELLEELKSASFSPAVNALDRLHRENWLDEDYFIGKDLFRANWEGAFIGGLNFESATLARANLNNVAIHNGQQLRPPSFRNADLRGVSFQSADLREAQLQDAYLQGAQLQGAILREAQLQGAYLFMAQLQGADLQGTELENVKWATEYGDRAATLPDGTIWTIEEDLERFTDRAHPKYNATFEKINTIRVDLGYAPLG